MTTPAPRDATTGRRPRIAFLSYSSGRFDSRTERMARSAIAAGYDVTVYARWESDVPPEGAGDGYRIVRASIDWRLAFPPTRTAARRRTAEQRRAALAAASANAANANATGSTGAAGSTAASGRSTAPARRQGRLEPLLIRLDALPGPLRLLARPVTAAIRLARRIVGQFLLFPIRPYAWGVALEELAEPADIWHGMWAGSLPALTRLRSRHGGRSVYDSRDVYLHARSFDRLPGVLRRVFRLLERRWARRADALITVNEAYADIIERTLGIRAAAIVMNCPPRFDPPVPRPDVIRERLGLGPDTRIVLYQGQFMTERGIEEGMDAILAVPDAVLVLLGFGALTAQLVAAAAGPPYAGRVFVVPAVPPSELLAWTASADCLLMAIQPTTLNHRYTTPNKLWEALAAGVPVVASDLPGMASIVTETGAGVLCDPTDPASIAAAIRRLLELPAEELDAVRGRALAAAHDRYNWERQEVELLGAYDRLRAAR